MKQTCLQVATLAGSNTQKRGKAEAEYDGQRKHATNENADMHQEWPPLADYANRGERRENAAREIRTPNLIWSQPRYRCVVAPLAVGRICHACVVHACQGMYDRRLSENMVTHRWAHVAAQSAALIDKLRPLAADADVTGTSLRNVRL